MELFFHQLQVWANNNDMVVNLNKTKEMDMGPPSKTLQLPLLQLSAGHIERVSSVKLLGISLDTDFSWKSHVEAITSKTTQRLYILKPRAGVRSTLRQSRPNKAGHKCPFLRKFVHKKFFDFIEIWHVGRGRWVMHDSMQYDQIQGQGHEPLKVGNPSISGAISSAIFSVSWQLTQDS